MKKIVIFSLKGLVFLVAFLAAAWFFMPWKQAGEYVLSVAQKELGRRNMPLSYSSVETVDSGFKVNDISVGGFMKLSFGSFTFRPSLKDSLANLAPAARISFAGGDILFNPPIRLGNGRALVVAGRKEIVLENLRTDGDFAINGLVTVDLTQNPVKIGRANAPIKVSESLEPTLQTMADVQLLPLERDGQGWRLRRP